MSIQRIYTQEEVEEMLSMIDSVYEIIEVYTYQHKNKNPCLEEWAYRWLKKARQFGVHPE